MPDVRVILVGTPGPAGSGLASHEALSNAIGHVRVVTSATRPSPTASDEGVIIYEEDTDKLYIWSGTAWQDLFQYYQRFRGARVKRTAVQSLVTATLTTIAWDAEDFDTDTFHDNATNNSRITIPSGLNGYYRVTANLHYTAHATGARSVLIRKNGADLLRADVDADAGATTHIGLTATLNLAAADYIEVQGFQSSGGNLDVLSTAGYVSSLEVEFLGK